MGHSVLANIIHAMSEDVSFTLDGKPAKATAGYVFARRLVKQGVSGTLNEQIKLANFLRTFGELNLESIREDIEKTVKEELEGAFREEQSRNAELLGYLSEALDVVNGCQLNFRAISDGFVGAKSTCSCGSFDAYSEAAQAIVEFFGEGDHEEADGEAEENDRARCPGWAPSRRSRLESEASAEDIAEGDGPHSGGPSQILKGGGTVLGPFGDDLTEGMIGPD